MLFLHFEQPGEVMSSGILSDKEMAELLAFRERARQISKLKAARRREKKAEAGLRQTNLWLSEKEAELVKRFVKFIRKNSKWRLSSYNPESQKFEISFVQDEIS